ncbi:unnamed protein product [Allacma fusca]|uniref:long-chain-fatty-acid--CoA ligase n=1 Tax=Allacma fusca TaxID=39272 RepID=A0A8J2JXI5_9HEXA|nr:unnamed protein product [Allacma fusca]
MSVDSSVGSWTLMCVNYLLVPLLVLLIVQHKFVWILLQTLKRDVTGAFRGLQTLYFLYTSRILNRTVGSQFNRVVAKYPNKVCFFYEDEKWTFRQVHQFANKVGNYFSSKGFRNGDVVCLFMENCPEYIPMWLGLSKIGVIPALINTNLRAQSLKHSIEIVNCKAVIYGEDISQAIQDVISLGCLSKVPIFSYARDGTVSIKSATNLAAVLTSCSIDEPIPGKRINYTDPIVYMYTSGTTGLPKAADFKGYADPAATKSKFAHDVLWKGDIFFRTGDSMVMDEFGYFYFNDRCGDTFRWKSENVSTAEVEAVISNICDLKDCVVYGVQIPGTEGRAGMATIVDPDSAINLEDFAFRLKKTLPSYARPLFVRFTNYIDLTGTFKLKKVDLQEEGFNIHKIQDSVYFFHGAHNKYVKLDEGLYNNLMEGKVRV